MSTEIKGPEASIIITVNSDADEKHERIPPSWFSYNRFSVESGLKEMNNSPILQDAAQKYSWVLPAFCQMPWHYKTDYFRSKNARLL